MKVKGLYETQTFRYKPRQKEIVVLVLKFQPSVKIKYRKTRIHQFSYECGVFLLGGHKFLIVLKSKQNNTQTNKTVKDSNKSDSLSLLIQRTSLQTINPFPETTKQSNHKPNFPSKSRHIYAELENSSKTKKQCQNWIT